MYVEKFPADARKAWSPIETGPFFRIHRVRISGVS